MWSSAWFVSVGMLVLRGVHGIACESLGAQQHQRSRSLCFASRVLEPTAPALPALV